MKYTHKPISQSAVPGDECLMQLREHGRVVVARVPEPEMRDFIVRACNAHEKLVAAILAVHGEMGKRISRSAFDEFSARTKALLDETFVLIRE